jgi:hypothetical protein
MNPACQSWNSRVCGQFPLRTGRTGPALPDRWSWNEERTRACSVQRPPRPTDSRIESNLSDLRPLRSWRGASLSCSGLETSRNGRDGRNGPYFSDFTRALEEGTAIKPVFLWANRRGRRGAILLKTGALFCHCRRFEVNHNITLLIRPQRGKSGIGGELFPFYVTHPIRVQDFPDF